MILHLKLSNGERASVQSKIDPNNVEKSELEILRPP